MDKFSFNILSSAIIYCRNSFLSKLILQYYQKVEEESSFDNDSEFKSFIIEHFNHIEDALDSSIIGESNNIEKKRKEKQPSINESFTDSIFWNRNAEIIDFRIKALIINNFRGFPKLEIPVGLNLSSQDNEPKSLVLIGSNGIGKSSLFEAMEYILTNSVGEAKLRSHDVKPYLVYGNQGVIDQHEIKIITNNGGQYKNFHEVNDVSKGVMMSSFVCSEWDLYNIGQKQDSNSNGYNNFLMSFLGLEEIAALKSRLEFLKTSGPVLDDYQLSKETIESEVSELKLQQNRLLSEMFNEYQGKNLEFNYKEELETLKQNIEFVQENLEFKQNDLEQIADKNLTIEQKLEKRDIYQRDLSMTKKLMEKNIPILIKFAKMQIDNIQIIKDVLKIHTDLRDKISEFSGWSTHVRNNVFFLRDFDKYFSVNITKSLVDILNMLIKFENSTKNNTFQDSIISFNENRLFVQEFMPLQRKYIETQSRLEQVSYMLSQRDLYSELISQISIYLEYLNEYILSIIKGDFNIIKDSVIRVMKNFCKEGEEIIFKYELENVNILVRFSDDKNQVQEISPVKYFNTFRYKLFCMMLKLATSIALMKRYNINCPLILDDVFYASDYDHRLLIKRFIVELFAAYKEVMGNSDLQLICFTHDEIILDTINESIQEMNLEKKFLFGRLFNYKEMIDRPKALINVNGNDVFFSNLYLELFKEL